MTEPIEILELGRLATVSFIMKGVGKVCVGSVYMIGAGTLCPRSRELMRKLTNKAMQYEGPVLMGGDYNMEPSAARGTLPRQASYSRHRGRPRGCMITMW